MIGLLIVSKLAPFRRKEKVVESVDGTQEAAAY